MRNTWAQVSGDWDAAQYGATFSRTSDAGGLELLKIVPMQEYDEKASPRLMARTEAWYSVADLAEILASDAIRQFVGMTPEQWQEASDLSRAVAALDYGHDCDTETVKGTFWTVARPYGIAPRHTDRAKHAAYMARLER